MMAATFITATIWEDSGCFLMARVRGNAGSNITIASITSITSNVYDESNVNTLVAGPTTQTVSSVVFDTLQTDSRWTKDSTGYNVGVSALAAWFPTGGHLYRVELAFVPVSGENFKVLYRIHAQNLVAS
jgi:hypothetical protein